MKRVLLTGFGPFPGASRNPSATLAGEVLKRHRNRLARFGIELHAAVLPVEFARIGPALDAIAAQTRPDAILHTGLASRSREVRVEMLARNRLSLLHGDAARQRASGHRISNGPDFLPTPLPVRQMLQILRAASVKARLSMDAGDYICNQTLYLSLAAGYRAGFIHIPRLRPREFRPRIGKPGHRMPWKEEDTSRHRRLMPGSHAAQLARAIASALLMIGVSLRRP